MKYLKMLRPIYIDWPVIQPGIQSTLTSRSATDLTLGVDLRGTEGVGGGEGDGWNSCKFEC